MFPARPAKFPHLNDQHNLLFHIQTFVIMGCLSHNQLIDGMNARVTFQFRCVFDTPPIYLALHQFFANVKESVVAQLTFALLAGHIMKIMAVVTWKRWKKKWSISNELSFDNFWTPEMKEKNRKCVYFKGENERQIWAKIVLNFFSVYFLFFLCFVDSFLFKYSFCTSYFFIWILSLWVRNFHLITFE